MHVKLNTVRVKKYFKQNNYLVFIISGDRIYMHFKSTKHAKQFINQRQ